MCDQDLDATVRLEARLAALNTFDTDKIAGIVAEILATPPQNVYRAPADAHSKACAEYIQWANEHAYLKDTVAEVPLGIMPVEYEPATLHDIRVNPDRKMRTDDAIYESDTEVRQRVARGNCFMQLRGTAAGSLDCAVQSLRKFTGGLGDDDDAVEGDDVVATDEAQLVWQRFFLQPMAAARHVVSMEKANGEAAHLSVRRVGDAFILFPGSKNVHIAVRSRADVAKWADGRFLVARNVAGAIFDVLDALAPDDLQRVLVFMAVTKYTATFELLQPSYQHVVHLGEPSTPSTLCFLAWTSSRLQPQTSLCSINPVIGCEIARVLGFLPVAFQIIPVANLDARMLAIRNGYNSEGDVLYFLDEAGAVMGLLKKKTAWYVFLRACREKVKAAVRRFVKETEGQRFNKPELVAASQRKIHARFEQVRDWLCVDEACLAAYSLLARAFLEWAIDALDNQSATPRDFEGLFPVMWRRFLTETAASDIIAANIMQDASPARAAATAAATATAALAAVKITPQ